LDRILAEIFLRNRSASELKAGDIAVGGVDLIFVQDTTGPLAVRQFRAIGFNRLINPGKTIVFLDRDVPSPSRVLSNFYNLFQACACPGEMAVGD
jgi:3-isopropylmalate/(R)-2-methylmalate dehydratase large subunit